MLEGNVRGMPEQMCHEIELYCQSNRPISQELSHSNGAVPFLAGFGKSPVMSDCNINQHVSYAIRCSQVQHSLELRAQTQQSQATPTPTPTSLASDSTSANLAVPLGVSFGVTAFIACAVVATVVIVVVVRRGARVADSAADLEEEGLPNETYGSEHCNIIRCNVYVRMYSTMQLTDIITVQL